uniref:J domain-containing protein n=1 Tax=Globodera pallida TaxID=36090 RepID=A0A183BXQ4_GLOPA
MANFFNFFGAGKDENKFLVAGKNANMNYYELLGVSDKAKPDEINKVYRERMRAYHPDRNPNGKAMSRLFTEAKETLMDPHKKGIYDQQMYNYATVVHHQGGEPMDYTVVVPVLASIINKDLEDHMMDAFTGVGGGTAAAAHGAPSEALDSNFICNKCKKKVELDNICQECQNQVPL